MAPKVAAMLNQCWNKMDSLLKWLKEAEQKTKQWNTVPKKKDTLEAQLQELQVSIAVTQLCDLSAHAVVQIFIDDVNDHSSCAKETEDIQSQFLETAKVCISLYTMVKFCKLRI